MSWRADPSCLENCVLLLILLFHFETSKASQPNIDLPFPSRRLLTAALCNGKESLISCLSFQEQIEIITDKPHLSLMRHL